MHAKKHSDVMFTVLTPINDGVASTTTPFDVHVELHSMSCLCSARMRRASSACTKQFPAFKSDSGRPEWVSSTFCIVGSPTVSSCLLASSFSASLVPASKFALTQAQSSRSERDDVDGTWHSRASECQSQSFPSNNFLGAEAGRPYLLKIREQTLQNLSVIVCTFKLHK